MATSEGKPRRPRPIEALRRATDACRERPLGALATQSVIGEGPLRAVLMVVGEQPGEGGPVRTPIRGTGGKAL